MSLPTSLRSLVKQVVWRLLRPVVRHRGPAGHVYLTFDDGPHPQLTPRLLDLLQQARVQATFFMTGDLMQRHPELVRRVRELGHTIGLHGSQHQHVHDLSLLGQWRDLRAMARTAQGFGLPFRFYRPPYGELSVTRILWCWLHRVRIVMWTLDSGDSFAAGPEDLQAQSAQWVVRAGEVVLFHDDTAATVDSMPALLDRFKRTQLELAPLL